MQRPQYGFTLVESLMAVAIGASLAMLALPALSALGGNTQSAGDLLASDLREARRLAVMRSEKLVVCPVAAVDARCADGTDWSAGWMVVGGDATEPLILRRLPSEAGVRVERLDAPTPLALAADGSLHRADGAFGAARWVARGDTARWTCLSPAGHARSAGENGC